MGSQKRIRVAIPTAQPSTVWVIQRCYLNVDRYWNGTVTDHDHRGWTIDPAAAIQFKRKEDAERVRDYLLERTGLLVLIPS